MDLHQPLLTYGEGEGEGDGDSNQSLRSTSIPSSALPHHSSHHPSHPYHSHHPPQPHTWDQRRTITNRPQKILLTGADQPIRSYSHSHSHSPSSSSSSSPRPSYSHSHSSSPSPIFSSSSQPSPLTVTVPIILSPTRRIQTDSTPPPIIVATSLNTRFNQRTHSYSPTTAISPHHNTTDPSTQAPIYSQSYKIQTVSLTTLNSSSSGVNPLSLSPSTPPLSSPDLTVVPTTSSPKPEEFHSAHPLSHPSSDENGSSNTWNSILSPASVALVAISSSPIPSQGEEFRLIMRLAYPVALAILFRVAMAVSDVSILGHKDSDYLAAAASALVWMNITASFLYRAFGSSLNTLCSQAYGAGNFKLVGIWLQQGLVFSSIAGIFVGFSWWWTEDILKGLRIDHKIAALAGKFAQWSIIWLPAQIWMEMLQRYFQAQHIIFPALAMNAIFVGINILLNLLFVFGIPASWWAKGISSSLHEHGWDGLGLIGSPIATSISRWLMLIFYWIYTCLYRKYHVKTFDGWSLTRSETFHPNRIRQYLVGQCLPSAVGVCLEQWQLEIVALFATRLGSNAIATHNATLEVFFLLTSFMFGLVAAVQIRIGTYLGGGQPLAAQQVAKIGLKVSLLIGGVIGICFILLRNWIGKIYSSDPSIWELAQHISLIVGAAYALLSFFYTGMSILNGTGRPLIVAIAYLIGCWCICLPLTYVFAFTLDQGLIGLWYGLCCGYGVVTLIVTYASFRTDWSKCSELAQLRAELHRPNRTDEKRTKTHRRKRRQTRNLGLHRNRNLNLNLDVSRFASSESTQVNENLGLEESTINRQHFISTTTREDEFPSIHESAYETNSEMNSDSESESDWNLEEIEYREEQLRQQRNHAQQQQQ